MRGLQDEMMVLQDHTGHYLGMCTGDVSHNECGLFMKFFGKKFEGEYYFNLSLEDNDINDP